MILGISGHASKETDVEQAYGRTDVCIRWGEASADPEALEVRRREPDHGLYEWRRLWTALAFRRPAWVWIKERLENGIPSPEPARLPPLRLVHTLCLPVLRERKEMVNLASIGFYAPYSTVESNLRGAMVAPK